MGYAGRVWYTSRRMTKMEKIKQKEFLDSDCFALFEARRLVKPTYGPEVLPIREPELGNDSFSQLILIFGTKRKCVVSTKYSPVN